MIFFKEYVNKKRKQLIYKAVFQLKTYSSNMYLGIESLYKPSGFPSFEVISYIMDTDLENISLVLNTYDINENNMLACGDLKEIYSMKNFQQTETVRVGQ